MVQGGRFGGQPVPAMQSAFHPQAQLLMMQRFSLAILVGALLLDRIQWKFYLAVGQRTIWWSWQYAPRHDLVIFKFVAGRGGNSVLV